MKKGRKFDQVLNGALNVFLANGFEGASVDDIAREANVSKATLYSYFENKADLFTQVAAREIHRFTEAAVASIDANMPAPVVLQHIGRHYIQFWSSDLGLGLYRICIAEARRFPEIGRRFFEQGLMPSHTLLCEYLALAENKGELAIAEDERALAAFQFSELCRSGVVNKRLFFVQSRFSKAELDKIVKSAVKMFLARYQTGLQPS
jgi:AcrR family transcriptional regulator